MLRINGKKLNKYEIRYVLLKLLLSGMFYFILFVSVIYKNVSGMIVVLLLKGYYHLRIRKWIFDYLNELERLALLGIESGVAGERAKGQYGR